MSASTAATPPQSAIPTSRYAPLTLSRPLRVFGAAFHVEISTGITLNPDTVMRAAIGKSAQTFLREKGQLSLLKKLNYGIRHQHKLSSTSRRSVLQFVGPLADRLEPILDGAPVPHDYEGNPDWINVANSFPREGDEFLLAIVTHMAAIDRIAEDATRQAMSGDREGAEKALTKVLPDTKTHWTALAPEVSMQGRLLIDTALQVLASRDPIGHDGLPTSPVLELLERGHKPLGHWLLEVATVAGCQHLGELADLLLREAVHFRRRPISHDTLKAWSSMGPGKLMSLNACNALVAIVQDEPKRNRLVARFAAARFLAFLCDFLQSSILGEPMPWKDAQLTIAERYRACLKNNREQVNL